MAAVPRVDATAVRKPTRSGASIKVDREAGVGTGCPYAPRCPRRQPLCSEQRPALRAVGSGHRAACHFAEQVMISPLP